MCLPMKYRTAWNICRSAPPLHSLYPCLEKGAGRCRRPASRLALHGCALEYNGSHVDGRHRRGCRTLTEMPSQAEVLGVAALPQLGACHFQADVHSIVLVCRTRECATIAAGVTQTVRVFEGLRIGRRGCAGMTRIGRAVVNKTHGRGGAGRGGHLTSQCRTKGMSVAGTVRAVRCETVERR